MLRNPRRVLCLGDLWLLAAEGAAQRVTALDFRILRSGVWAFKDYGLGIRRVVWVYGSGG